MLHFHWFKHSWRRANIFRYRKVYSGIFPFVKKYGSFFCEDEQTGEVKTIATNPLQWRHKNKAIATKLLQSDDVVFLSATFPYSYLVRIQTISFSLVRFQHIQPINTIITVLSICTGNITLGHQWNSQAQTSDYLDLGWYFPVQIEKTVVIALVLPFSFFTLEDFKNLKLYNCPISCEVDMYNTDITSRAVFPSQHYANKLIEKLKDMPRFLETAPNITNNLQFTR